METENLEPAEPDDLASGQELPELRGYGQIKVKSHRTVAASEILVVNDNESALRMLKLQLEMLGHSVSLAQSGEIALQLIAEQNFDVVVLDLNMPGLSGHDVLEKLKEQDLLSVLPVIVVSASSERNDVLQSLERGASDYLQSPVDTPLLRARVGAALAWRRMRQIELEHLRGLAQIIRAVEAMDQGTYAPADLEAWEQRNDSLGELARCLQKLANHHLQSSYTSLEALRGQLHEVHAVLSSQLPQSTVTGRVLVVEDEPASRLILTGYLKQLGYEVESASDGQEGLEMLAAKSFDSILMDVVMPRLDGFAMLAAIKQDPSIRDIPVIALSAVEDIEQVVRLIGLGAHDHLTKPFQPQLLRARLQSCLVYKRMRDQELSMLRGLSRLSQAAADIESDSFEFAQLDDLSRRADMLGQLARVFQAMAREIRNRQQSLKRQVGDLRSELEEARRRAQLVTGTQQDYAQTLEAQSSAVGGSRFHLFASFRGGTGKTTVVANLAVTLARAGLRVALVDAALNSPGLHKQFGLVSRDLGSSLHDFLTGDIPLSRVALDLSDQLGITGKGRLFLLPASAGVQSLARMLRQGYEPKKFSDSLKELLDELKLDRVFFDSESGLSEELLLCMLLSQSVSFVLRSRSPDLEGTGSLIQIARKLKVERLNLVFNWMGPDQDEAELSQRYQEMFQLEVASILPFQPDLDELFSLRQPDSPCSKSLTRLVTGFLA